MNVEEATFRGVELAVADVELLGARWGAQASAITFDGSEASDFESKSALRPMTCQVAVDVDRSVVADVGVRLRGDVCASRVRGRLRPAGRTAAQAHRRWTGLCRPDESGRCGLPGCFADAIAGASSASGIRLELAAVGPELYELIEINDIVHTVCEPEMDPIWIE